MNYLKLSQEVSYALRHAPEEYGLTLDKDGFVEMNRLACAINKKSDYGKLVEPIDLEQMVARAKKQRHEIRDGKIRALYGHSTEERIEKTPREPPSILYHATARSSLESIMSEGLKPMDRQYVHLSSSADEAFSVGRRHDETPALLTVDAAQAAHDGIAFYEGNDSIWLADSVPAEYLHML